MPGFVIGGLIVDHVAYEWLFWLGADRRHPGRSIATYRFIPESPVKTPAKIDWGGAALLSGGLASLLIAVSEGNSWGWTSATFVGLVVLAVVLLVRLDPFRGPPSRAPRRHADDAQPPGPDDEPDRAP